MKSSSSSFDVPSLVAQAQAGDRDAINRLADLYWDEIRSFLARQGYPARYDADEEASDLTQKTFIKLESALEGYAESGRFAAWLRKVAKYEYQTWLRSLIRQSLATLRTRAGPSPSESRTLFATGKEELRPLVAELSKGERVAWELWIAGFTHAEIATKLGISVGASQVRVSRAKKHLLASLRANRQSPGD